MLGESVPEVLDVGASTRRNERRGPELPAKQASRVERLEVDVLGVPRERERAAADHGGQPGHRRRAVGEVRVQGLHVASPVHLVDQGHGQEQLLGVDAPRPPAVARPERLGDRCRDGPGETEGVATYDGGEGWSERAEVLVEPARQ